MSTNPLSATEPGNLVADGYAETTMVVFEQLADAVYGNTVVPDCRSPLSFRYSDLEKIWKIGAV
ncbi:hypothetical protein [Ferriphaselus sp. R-1]|uniref:hypothetical protein n=1 Tax=Ferriphaselus sp. R-1 TaxID=1485544 RepID=UPI000555B8C2|nr:hypothetical protein [Ferriphaselus sp. R-1]